jgi:hypothetical protein
MAGFIALAEALEIFGILFAGLTILMLIRWVPGEALVFLVLSTICFVIASAVARQARANFARRHCLACGGMLQGNPPACPRCDSGQ